MGIVNQTAVETRRNSLSLRFKLILGFAALSAFVSFITARGMYTNLQSQVLNEFRIRALSIVKLAALQQDGDEFKQITSDQDPLYEKFRLQNLKIRQSDPDIRSVFTMRKDNQGIFYVVDAGAKGETNIATFGERYIDAPATLVDNFDALASATAEPKINNGQNGSYLSAYAPIRAQNGESVGVIGVDILADTIVHEQRQILLQSVLIFFIALGLGIFFGYVTGNALTEPIVKLTQRTRAFAAGEFIERIDIETGDEISDLAETFNGMAGEIQGLISGLEQRVTERTADVELARLLSERRAQELQAISEISRTVSTEQRLEILLPLVTRLVGERFDYYHVGIFFVDVTRQFAVLQASNSEGGKRMLARSHRLEVGLTGIVGTVAQTGKPRIALDVGADATFFDNPDLPETRSEMSLPLNFRGETIGVLDVQSLKPGAFTESDAKTLAILADQIAIAIENARLFSQTQQAREEAEALYNQFLRVEWKTFLQQETSIGYRQSTIGGKLLDQPIETDEIRQALQNGKIVMSDGSVTAAQPFMVIPVQLRGQTIGVLNIKAPTKNRKWNQDEMNLAQAVSDRLALALDNARLLQDSQRRAAKEAKIGEVTSKIGASINMRNVLQTAVEELGRALPGSEVVIQFQQEDGKD